MTAPDFEALRRSRNEHMQKMLRRLATEFGVPADELVKSTFNPNDCYCACPDGPCEHRWDGPIYNSEDGSLSSATCSRCGGTAFSHHMRVCP